MYHCLIDNKSFGNERSLINYIKKKYDLNYVTYQINNNLLDSNDYIRCEICGQYCKVLKNHISSNHKGIIFDDYVIKYSPIKTVCESTLKILADNMKGENNPNHTSNCSLLKRRENSPLCKEFWLLRGGDDKSSETLEKAKNNRSYTSRLDYWLSRSNDLEHAKTLLKERQSTFSLKNCISKYGDAGLNVWNNRQTKWLKSLHINGNLKLGYSKISQELFDERIQAGYDDYLEQYSIAKKMNRLNYLNSDIYTNGWFTQTGLACIAPHPSRALTILEFVFRCSKDLDLYGRFVPTIK